VPVTAAGRQVADQATARRRWLIADVLSLLPADQQRDVARSLAAFAAAGEVPAVNVPEPGVAVRSKHQADEAASLPGPEGDGQVYAGGGIGPRPAARVR